MKTRIILSLLLAVSLFFSGCKTEGNLQTPVTFYYRNANTFEGTDTSIILGETRDAGEHKEDIKFLLDLYLQGPVSETLLQVFPDGVQLVSYQIKNGNAQVVLSDEIAQLDGIALSIACGCLAKTVMTLDDVYGVRIYAETKPLGHRDYVYMDNETLLLLDENQESQ